MDEIKITIKTYFELLIMIGCLILVISLFFYTEDNGGMGIFGKVKEAFSILIKEKQIEVDGTGHLQEIGNRNMPELLYSQGVLQKGDCVEFKSLFSVKLQNGTVVSAREEIGFAIYLLDIENKDGTSRLEVTNMNSTTNKEETAFLYNKEEDLLYILNEGIYIVEVRIYSDAGGADTYTFQLPVE